MRKLLLVLAVGVAVTAGCVCESGVSAQADKKAAYKIQVAVPILGSNFGFETYYAVDYPASDGAFVWFHTADGKKHKVSGTILIDEI